MKVEFSVSVAAAALKKKGRVMPPPGVPSFQGELYLHLYWILQSLILSFKDAFPHSKQSCIQIYIESCDDP